MPSNAPPMLPHSLTVPDVFAELWGPWGSTSEIARCQEPGTNFKEQPRRAALSSFSMLLSSMLRRFHRNPFGCNCKGARGDYIPIQIVIEEIARTAIGVPGHRCRLAYLP